MPRPSRRSRSGLRSGLRRTVNSVLQVVHVACLLSRALLLGRTLMSVWWMAISDLHDVSVAVYMTSGMTRRNCSTPRDENARCASHYHTLSSTTYVRPWRGRCLSRIRLYTHAVDWFLYCDINVWCTTIRFSFWGGAIAEALARLVEYCGNGVCEPFILNFLSASLTCNVAPHPPS